MKQTKLVNLSLMAACFFFYASAFAQIDTPAPSPAGSASTKVGLTDIEVNYFRPQMKGRKIFGSGDGYLVPSGQMWRAGANQGTTVKFSDDVKVGGQDLAAGEYLLLATPGADEWTVIFYKDVKMGGNLAAYQDSSAAAKVVVKPTKLSQQVSTLTYNITDISETSESANLELAWENTSVKVPITVSFDDKISGDIAGSLVTAANYYLAQGKNLESALAMMDMYLAEGENSKKFWHVHTKARILAKLGKKKEAKAAANASMELAKNFPQGDFGYIKRNQDLIAGL